MLHEWDVSPVTDIANMTSGTAMYYNWNRMVVLDRLPQTEKVIQERDMRSSFQNAFSAPAGDGEDPRCQEVARMVKTTLLPEVIASVDKLMKHKGGK